MNTYTLHTKPRQERRIEEQLSARGLNVFLPMMQTTRLRYGKKATVTEPLFPGYVFVDLDLTDQTWLDVKYTPGVKDFLKIDNKPAIIDGGIIAALKAKHVGKVIPVNNTKHCLKAGDKVTITSGPMKDIEGVFKEKSGEARSWILLRILTEETRLLIDDVYLEKK